MAYTESITLIKDKQEKPGLSFSRYKDVSMVVEHLKQGDYTAILHTKYGDFRSRTVFERKSKDLWTSLTKRKCKLSNEYNRSIDAGERLILIIDRSASDIKSNGFGYPSKGKFNKSTIKGATINKTINSMWVGHGFLPIYCENEKEMKLRIVDRFMAECRYVNRLFKEKQFDKINRIVFREEGSNEETIL